MLLGALVGRQVLVAAALRKISTHAYSSLVAKRPCLLNQVIGFEFWGRNLCLVKIVLLKSAWF